MADDTAQRLERALRKRDSLAADVQRIKGKLEAAQNSLAEVEAEIRQKGLEPDQVQGAIAKLQERYESLVSDIERDVATAEAALAPYLKESP